MHNLHKKMEFIAIALKSPNKAIKSIKGLSFYNNMVYNGLIDNFKAVIIMYLDSIFTLIKNPFIQLAFFLFLIFLNIILLIYFFRYRKKLNSFLQGKDAQTLEESINKLISDTEVLRSTLEKISLEQKKQDSLLQMTVKKIGIVRFNPFNNTGGDQSFAIALLNSMNSGVLISSLYLREGTRIYAKPIDKLKSSYPLSKEEEEAIKKATDSANEII